jgi:hypothetical protein
MGNALEMRGAKVLSLEDDVRGASGLLHKTAQRSPRPRHKCLQPRAILGNLRREAGKEAVARRRSSGGEQGGGEARGTGL